VTRLRRSLLEEGDSTDRGDAVAAEIRALAVDKRWLAALASIVDREFYVRFCDRYRVPARKVNRELANFERAARRALATCKRLAVRNAMTERWAAELTAMAEEALSLRRPVVDPRKEQSSQRCRFVGGILYMLMHREDDRSGDGINDHPDGLASRVTGALCKVAHFPYPQDDKNRRAILQAAFKGLREAGVRMEERPTKRARSRRDRADIAPSSRR
jgi:hypothetical protein